MADLFKFMLTHWNVIEKGTKADLINQYATRSERRKFKKLNREIHISELAIFKKY